MRIRPLLIVSGFLAACGSHSGEPAATPANESVDQPPISRTTDLVPLPTATTKPKAKFAPVLKAVHVTMENGAVRTIEPLNYSVSSWDVPARSCTVSGKLEGLAGGNKDFEAYLLDEDNYRVWQGGLEPTGTSSARAQKWSFSERVKGPGKYHLVISNKFSQFTKKAVKVWANLNCPEVKTS